MGSYAGSSDWDDLPSSTSFRAFKPRSSRTGQQPAAPAPSDAAGSEVEIGDVAGDRKRLNCILAFDTTGSMTRWVENVQAKMEYLAVGLLKLMDMDIELIGVGDHGDGRNMLQIKPFSRDLDVLKRSIEDLKPTDGGDTPEAFECLFKVLNAGSYDVPTVLVLITDSIPHDMDDYTGDDDGCPFGVDYLTELEELRDKLAKIYLISCATDPHILAMQRQLVDANGFLELGDLHRLVNLVMAICMDEVGELDAFIQILEQQRGAERRDEILSLLRR